MVLTKVPETDACSDHFDDRRMEMIMGRVLQFGVMLASLVMLTGGILYLKAHHATKPNYEVFASEPQTLRHFSGIVHGIAGGEPAAIIQLAVLLLIATPVARVVFALISFGIERDKLYIFVSALVLAVLLYGFLRSQ